MALHLHLSGVKDPDMKTLDVRRSRWFTGRIRFPGDKSMTHRCVLFASLATGRSEIRHPATGEDCCRSIQALMQLGVKVERHTDSLTVDGLGLHPKLRSPQHPLDCGNSGTTIRLLLGLLAGTAARTTLTGDRSLSGRPMGRVVAPLREMGALVNYLGAESRLPIEVIGTHLRGVTHTLAVPSAQVKSAILLAALGAEGETRVCQSVPTRDHAERLLIRMGSGLRIEEGWLIQPSVSSLAPFDLEIPGDPSSAAFFAVGAALHPGSEVILENISLNPHRIGYLEVLSRMGAEVTCLEVRSSVWEPCGDIRIRGNGLAGVTIEPDEIPDLIDELPVLAVAMACAEGESHVNGAGELRLKESDRLAVLARELGRFGVQVLEHPEGFSIRGGNTLRAPVHSDPSGDHRMAMAMAILGTVVDRTTRVRQAECIHVSFPEFASLLHQVTGG